MALTPSRFVLSLILLLGLGLAFSIGLGSGNSLSAATDNSGAGGQGEGSACQVDETDQAMLDAVNEARAEARDCGDQSFAAAGELTWNCTLEDAARAHSEDMVEQEFFSHTGPDGLRIADRVDARGYSWTQVGENIAAGQKSVDEVVDGWIESPGHCGNIMNPEFTEMGAARVEAPGSQYSPFWTQVFGRPR